MELKGLSRVGFGAFFVWENSIELKRSKPEKIKNLIPFFMCMFFFCKIKDNFN
jgi:hypothetical protein